jgi:hypothetical protein
MGSRKNAEGNAQEHESETGDDFNDAADNELVREGEEEIGDDESESDSEDDEQSEDEENDDESDEDEEDDLEEEDQDEDEEEEEEEADEEEEPASTLKGKDGKFNWKAINAKLGKVGAELERSFSEAQKTTNGALQAKAEVEKNFGEFQQQVQVDLERFSQMDHLYTTNPEVHHAINRALGIAPQGGAPNVPQGGNLLQMPEGVDPQDPLAQHMLKSFAPVVQNLQNQVHQLLNHHRSQQTREGKAAQVQQFRQGVIQAGDAFRKILGREPSDQELTAVAEKMRTSGNFNGADLIPVLFLEEIQRGARRQVQQIQKKKRDLPRSSKSGSRSGAKTSKAAGRREAFDEEWDRHMK